MRCAALSALTLAPGHPRLQGAPSTPTAHFISSPPALHVHFPRFRSRGRGRPGRVRSPIRNSNSPARRGGSPPAGTVVVVRNLTRNTNAEHIKEIFSHYGDVKSVRLDTDVRSKLRCFFPFPSPLSPPPNPPPPLSIPSSVPRHPSHPALT
jgi:hypothetical protein